MTAKLLLLELNELNFEFVEDYIAQGHLPTFRRIFEAHGFQLTTSETDYENIEPWIQWVTAHTGLDYADHGVFRLGDIVGRDFVQIWEDLEGRGLRVGAVSPMNAQLRMRKPAFFLPDPWTDGGVAAPGIVRRLYSAVAGMVSQNAEGGVPRKLLFDLVVGAIQCARPANFKRYAQYAWASRRRSWKRALVLDLLLTDVFVGLVERSRADFASLFLNAAAHIQHHYMFSSSVYRGEVRNPDWYVRSGDDPVLDVYQLYDSILDMLIRTLPDYRIMIATGLHQVPYPDQSFYWRLRDHDRFLRDLDIPFVSVEPRMSRDFLVTCKDEQQAADAAHRLGLVCDLDRIPLFEIDNRGTSLFVTLSYRHEITDDMSYLVGNEERSGLKKAVAFVAIKNGHHDGTGYFLDTGVRGLSPASSFPLKELPEKIRSVVL